MDEGGMILLPQAAQSAPLMIIPDTSMEAERLSGSHGLACTSDTSSGPVPTVSADAVNNLTVVPLTNMNSVSLAAAAAVAAEKQQLAAAGNSPQQQKAKRERSYATDTISAP